MKADVVQRRPEDTRYNIMYPSYFDQQTMDTSDEMRREIQQRVLHKHRFETQRQLSVEKNLVDKERRKSTFKSSTLKGSNDPRNVDFDFRDSYEYENYRHHGNGVESARELHHYDSLYDGEIDDDRNRSHSSFASLNNSPRPPGSQGSYDPQSDLYDKLKALKVPKINVQRVPGIKSYAEKFRQNMGSYRRSNNSSRTTMLSMTSTASSRVSSRDNSARSREILSSSRIPKKQRVGSETSSTMSSHRVPMLHDTYGSRQSPVKMNGYINDTYESHDLRTPDILVEEMKEIHHATGAIKTARAARGTIQVTLKSDQKNKEKLDNTLKVPPKKSSRKIQTQQDASQVNSYADNEQFINNEYVDDHIAQSKGTNNVSKPDNTRMLDSETKVQYVMQKKRTDAKREAKPARSSYKAGNQMDKENVTQPIKEKTSKSVQSEKLVNKAPDDIVLYRALPRQESKNTEGSDNKSDSNIKTGSTKTLKQMNNSQSTKNKGNQNDAEGKKNNTQSNEKRDVVKPEQKKKPQKGILRKTSSFKVMGSSDNYFGYMSLQEDVAADKKKAKKVRYHADQSSETRPVSA